MKNIDLSLYLVTGEAESDEEFLKIIEEAIIGGVRIVQLREKTADTLDFYKLAVKVKKLTSEYNVPLIINDRLDIALAVDADGVHVGQSDMPCSVARELIGDDKILGVSATTVSEAKKAEDDGADYIGSGAVFPTKTKKDASSITKKDLTDTGIKGLSVVSEIMNADNPRETSEKLLNIFNS